VYYLTCLFLYGVTVEHRPPHVEASSAYIPSVVTSGKGLTVTLIGAGSAAGQAIPPYLVFPGQGMRNELLATASILWYAKLLHKYK